MGFYRIEFVIDCSLLMLVLSVGKISRDEYIELDLLKTILRAFHFSQTLSLGSLKWAGNFKTDRRIMLIIGKVGLNSLQKGIYEVLSVRGTQSARKEGHTLIFFILDSHVCLLPMQYSFSIPVYSSYLRLS